jgi:hypothetical protein
MKQRSARSAVELRPLRVGARLRRCAQQARRRVMVRSAFAALFCRLFSELHGKQAIPTQER